MKYPNGRTAHEASLAGDWFHIERLDGRSLAMPGCGGIEETLVAARRHWPAHVGERVTLRPFLPGSVIGCAVLGEATVATL